MQLEKGTNKGLYFHAYSNVVGLLVLFLKSKAYIATVEGRPERLVQHKSFFHAMKKVVREMCEKSALTAFLATH